MSFINAHTFNAAYVGAQLAKRVENAALMCMSERIAVAATAIAEWESGGGKHSDEYNHDFLCDDVSKLVSSSSKSDSDALEGLYLAVQKIALKGVNEDRHQGGCGVSAPYANIEDANKDSACLKDSNGYGVAWLKRVMPRHVPPTRTTLTDAEWQQTINLIAAAPDLLAALKSLVDDFERIIGRPIEAEHEAKAAISKAIGGAV